MGTGTQEHDIRKLGGRPARARGQTRTAFAARARARSALAVARAPARSASAVAGAERVAVLLRLCDLCDEAARVERRSRGALARLERSAAALAAEGRGGAELDRMIAAARGAYWRVACVRALVEDDLARAAAELHRAAGRPEA